MRVELHVYVGVEECEKITIEGPGASMTWRSTGTHGDLGTATIVLSIAEKAEFLLPGLYLMTKLLPFKIGFTV
jgi:4-hydroxy-tetrahydrodipicolinate reductase